MAAVAEPQQHFDCLFGTVRLAQSVTMDCDHRIGRQNRAVLPSLQLCNGDRFRFCKPRHQLGRRLAALLGLIDIGPHDGEVEPRPPKQDSASRGARGEHEMRRIGHPVIVVEPMRKR